MEKQLIESFKERCHCDCRFDYKRCQCGAAKSTGLICQKCEGELVLRRSSDSPFWGCSKFSTNGCKYVRRLKCPGYSGDFVPYTPTAEARTPVSRKKPKVVSASPRSTHHVSQSDTTTSTHTLQPKALSFPDKIALRETFIGPDMAEKLVADGFPPDVFFASASRTGEEGSPDRLFYEKPKKEILFSYFYKPDGNSYRCPDLSGEKPVSLELFAGAGGFSLGLQRAGFETKYAVEQDKSACDTLRSNHHGGMVVFAQPVSDFLNGEIKECNHIHASPPCQGCTEAKRNQTATDRDIENNKQMLLVPEAFQHHMPDTGSFENVRGLLSDSNKPYLQRVVAELLKLKYQVRGVLLNAFDYGDPQSRERVFLLISKKGYRLPEVPKRTLTRCTAGEALGSLEEIDPARPGIPVQIDGDGAPIYDHHAKDGMYGKMQFLERDKPSCTVRRFHRMHHYKCDREITIRERARLQSFPDSYHFCGTPDQQMSQIGNAVPVKLAEAVAKSIMGVYQR